MYVRVLLRSLWKTTNIGDVAHAPGALRAFQRFAPDVEVTLWPRRIEARERAMLQHYLPEVRIVEGQLDDSGPSTPELRKAFDQADLLVHGSGSGLGAEKEVAWWRENTTKPYGFFGVSVDPVSRAHGGATGHDPDFGTLATLGEMIAALPADDIAPQRRELLDGAAFVFCRDSLSLGHLRAQGIKPPVLDLGPDATFVYDLHDRAAADKVLADHNLAEDAFVCVIPRLRYTPFHKIHATAPTAESRYKDAESAKYLDGDMRHLRDLIAAIARQTDLKVLACPEESYEVELSRTELVEKLPDDVRGSVEWLPYHWPLETASAVYARAHSVVSVECHSPIMSVVGSTPTMYVRQPTDTIKGQMYRDLELAGSFVEIDDLVPGDLVSAWERIHADRPAAVEAVRNGSEVAQGHLRRMVETAVAAAGSRPTSIS